MDLISAAAGGSLRLTIGSSRPAAPVERGAWRVPCRPRRREAASDACRPREGVRGTASGHTSQARGSHAPDRLGRRAEGRRPHEGARSPGGTPSVSRDLGDGDARRGSANSLEDIAPVWAGRRGRNRGAGREGGLPRDGRAPRLIGLAFLCARRIPGAERPAGRRQRSPHTHRDRTIRVSPHAARRLEGLRPSRRPPARRPRGYRTTPRGSGRGREKRRSCRHRLCTGHHMG